MFATVTPQDRVVPDIWGNRFERYFVSPPDTQPFNYVLNPDSSLNLTVVFHAEVSANTARAALRPHVRSAEQLSAVGWRVVATRRAVRDLAALDLVRWIDAAPPPFLPDNDRTRAAINIDALQTVNAGTGQVTGLAGTGVLIGVYDSGIDETHDDFGARVVRNDHTRGRHGTHVAGTIAGGGTFWNGFDSWGVQNTGTAWQWRGMAPQAELIDVDNALANIAARWVTYIGNEGLDLSNHSYTFAVDGDYDASSEFRDELIRGDATSGGPIGARLHLHSAGNHGQFPGNGGEQVGYFALTKQVKNGLMVGNYDAGLNRIAQTSSLGPAHDGRIKPDVVAPGELSFRGMRVPLGVDIYATSGRRVFSDRTIASTKHARFTPRVGERYLLVLSPPTGMGSRWGVRRGIRGEGASTPVISAGSLAGSFPGGG
jgi:hypothetical protein